MQSMEQRRAAIAYTAITSRQAGGNNLDSYGRECIHLPSLIHKAGLCQTLAFYEAKGHDQVIDDLASVMEFQGGRNALMQQSRTASLRDYQLLTTRALRSAQWLKRYAEAILRASPGN